MNNARREDVFQDLFMTIRHQISFVLGKDHENERARLEAIPQLRETFPDISTDYLEQIIHYYQHERSSFRIVQRITEKILETQMGFYPRRVESISNATKRKNRGWFSSTSENNTFFSSLFASSRASSSGTDDLPTDAWNEALKELVERFPDADIAHLRSLVRITPLDSVVILTDHLLSMNEKGVGYPKRLSVDPLSIKDQFRSKKYRDQCQAELELRFPHLWSSTIQAILAESNYNFCAALEILSEMKAGFLWRTARILSPSSSSSSLSVSRRGTVDSSPMSSWLTKPMIIELNKISMDNLDPDLYLDFETLSRQKMQSETANDEALARQMNEQQYNQQGQSIDCSCCFLSYAFDDFAQCTNGHLCCVSCMKRFVEEGLFGQGQLRGKDKVPCFAMNITEGKTKDTESCHGFFSDSELQRCLPRDLVRQYTVSRMEKDIQNSGLSTFKCPFCFYQEEAPPINHIQRSLSWFYSNFSQLLKSHGVILYLSIIVLLSLQSPAPMSSVLFLTSTTAYIYKSLWVRHKYRASFEKAFRKSWIGQLSHKWFVWKEPLILNCKNPACCRVSCVECSKEWKPLHDCFGEEKDQLRLYVEQAMSDALIRICPSCNVRFSKVDGCNKMKCPKCGYSMCYICRKDISKEGYTHFCQHFRLHIGPCRECKKCDLYYHEADKVAVQQAEKRARRDWLAKHPNAKIA